MDVIATLKAKKSWSECEINPYNKECSTTRINSLSRFKKGIQGVETLTVEKIEPKYYTFSVHKYSLKEKRKKNNKNNSISNNYSDDVQLKDSYAKFSFYVDNLKFALTNYNVPSPIEENILQKSNDKKVKVYNQPQSYQNLDWWTILCFDGEKRIIQNLNKLSHRKVDIDFCHRLFEDS